MEVESHHINVFANDQGLVKIEAAFDREAFCESITDDGYVEVEVVGSLIAGRYFHGFDTIKIISRGRR